MKAGCANCVWPPCLAKWIKWIYHWNIKLSRFSLHLSVSSFCVFDWIVRERKLSIFFFLLKRNWNKIQLQRKIHKKIIRNILKIWMNRLKNTVQQLSRRLKSDFKCGLNVFGFNRKTTQFKLTITRYSPCYDFAQEIKYQTSKLYLSELPSLTIHIVICQKNSKLVWKSKLYFAAVLIDISLWSSIYGLQSNKNKLSSFSNPESHICLQL